MSVYEENVKAFEDSVIGKTVKEVREMAWKEGWDIRWIEVDGVKIAGNEMKSGTVDDWNPVRCNLSAKDDKVVKFFGMG